jgi:hypothetical protein
VVTVLFVGVKKKESHYLDQEAEMEEMEVMYTHSQFQILDILIFTEQKKTSLRRMVFLVLTGEEREQKEQALRFNSQ